MKSAKSLIIRLTLFAAAMVLLLIGVFQTIDRPVTGDSDTFTAVFTDANGLRTGDDVRMFGVRVGKVVSLQLTGPNAEVKFALQREHPVFENSAFAIRYQNLTGQRYLDVQQPADPTTRRSAKDVIGTDHTIPAFDVTTLFNGLQPVLAELTPADLNQFASSLLAVIEGNGSGIGPALDAIQKLSAYTTDRQAVISTLVNNLRQVSDHLGGRSGNAADLIAQLTSVFETLTEKVTGLIDFAITIPPVLVPAQDLLNTLGLTGDPNPAFDNAVHQAFPDPKQSVAVLSRLPALIQSLTAAIPRSGSDVQLACSHGSAEPPKALQVLIDGQGIALCNR